MPYNFRALILAQANHLETQDEVASVDSEESVIIASAMENLGETNAQDFHMMMGVILEELVDLQSDWRFPLGPP